MDCSLLKVIRKSNTARECSVNKYIEAIKSFGCFANYFVIVEIQLYFLIIFNSCIDLLT